MSGPPGRQLAGPGVTRQEVLDALRTYWTLHGHAPRTTDLCELTGLKSTSTVHAHLVALRAQGKVRGRAGWNLQVVEEDERP